MAAAANARGLCTNCESLPTCCLVRSDGPAVLFCEDHRVLAAAAPPWTGDECRDGLHCAPRRPAVAAGRSRSGLCCDCAAAASCCLTRPEGGVWHCEDYR